MRQVLIVITSIWGLLPLIRSRRSHSFGVDDVCSWSGAGCQQTSEAEQHPCMTPNRQSSSPLTWRTTWWIHLSCFMKLWLIITINSKYHILPMYERIQAAEDDVILTTLPTRHQCQKSTRLKQIKTKLDSDIREIYGIIRVWSLRSQDLGEFSHRAIYNAPPMSKWPKK